MKPETVGQASCLSPYSEVRFVICTPKSLRSDQRPLHHQRLPFVLSILEVEPSFRQSNGVNTFSIGRSKEPKLWDYLEEARNNHRRLIQQHHPDRGGSHEMAALVNAAWHRAKELLARKGIAFA